MSISLEKKISDAFSFVSEASTWIPDWLPNSAWIEHAPFAFWLMEAHEPGILIELGTHLGYSFFSFCQAIARLKLPTRAYAVDTWKGDEHAGFYGEEIFQEVSKHNAERYSSFSQLIRSTFDDALPYFEDGSVDLLHVDGRHFYEDVKHDFNSWLPKLSDRGIVLLHDINVRERSFGVFRYWAELSQRYPHFQFFHGWGLGVLGVGSKLPRPLKAIFETEGSPKRANKTRKIYARLGASLDDRLGHRRLANEIGLKEAETSALKAQISTLEAHVADSRVAGEAALSELSDVRSRLLALDIRGTELEAALTLRAGELSAVKNELAEKEGKTAQQRRELETALCETRQQLDTIELQLAAAQAALTHQREDAAQQRTDLERRLVKGEQSAAQQRLNLEGKLVEAKRSAAQQCADVQDKLAESEGFAAQHRSDLESRLAEAKRSATRQRADLDGKLAQVETFAAQQRFDLEGRLAEAERIAAQERTDLEAKLAEAERCLHAINASTAWRITRPARAALSRLPPGGRWLARQIVRTAYWLATPWNTPKRIRYLREWTLRNTGDAPSANMNSPSSGGAAAPDHSGLTSVSSEPTRTSDGLRRHLIKSHLFDPSTYLQLHEDLRVAQADPWSHFLEYGIREGRHFTTPELVARAIAQSHSETQVAMRVASQILTKATNNEALGASATPLASQHVRIGIYCNSQGNFFMQEIANLFYWQLKAFSVDAQLRTEQSDFNEGFDIRIFIAPHEFFWLGKGERWRSLAGAPGTVLYNVEQVQTPWFCRGFQFLLQAPLILDINFQTALLLRKMGLNAIHYMPPYLPECQYTLPQSDVSNVELLRGYEFSRQQFNREERRGLADRPIDILFVGTHAERRIKAIETLRDLTDKHRFVCVFTHQNTPLTGANYRTTSSIINCALAQRSKIVLNIHRSWLGYFEWSRMVMQGFWQAACVVSDPSLPDPVFGPNEHFLEENVRHLPELLRWLLDTNAGRIRMDKVADAGHRRARSSGAQTAMLLPMLNALNALVGIAGDAT